MKKSNQYLLVGASIVYLVALIVCFICDYFTSYGLSWSLIILLSLAASWLVVFVLLVGKKKVVLKLLITVSVIAVPFLFLLSLILHDSKIFSLGACIVLLSVAAIWIVYGLAIKYHGRIFLIVGLAFLISIPLTFGITYLAACFNGAIYTDVASDIFHAVISLELAGVSFSIDCTVCHLDRH